MFGFYRIAAAVPRLHLANPKENGKEIIFIIEKAINEDVSAIVFPELTLSGYTASDLFFQEQLYNAQNNALDQIIKISKKTTMLIVLGIAVRVDDRLYNAATIIQRGEILGIVPKTYLPNKREFYEKRQFGSGKNIINETINFAGREVPFGVDLLFNDEKGFTLGIEICEDLWAITPPSNQMASNGANIIMNLSASNELVGKADYRAELVRTQSARLYAAYAYASSGFGESTTDTVFGGDSIIAEYGSILARGKRFSFDNCFVTADIDIQKLTALRMAESSISDTDRKNIHRIKVADLPAIKELERYINPYPFVPSNSDEKTKRCEEISSIQAYGLIRRMQHAHIKRAVIGISGGLDSTLALLVTHKAFKIMGWNTYDILAVTMPGFGTTGRTYNNAIDLCSVLNVTLKEIPIKNIAMQEFEAIGHNPDIHDVTYENVQARARTSILMNMANKEGGLVVGTGDLSEIALGWSTYNGDHMSMYGLNSGIPKTLIRYLIEYFADTKEIGIILKDILETPVSPELLPSDGKTITQETEEIVGPYELHDFFLYHFIKYGATPKKILYLATKAFSEKYDKSVINKWLIVFIRRFFTQQFKRSCMPDGPKVGTISLSPRADWRMPSDAQMQIWIDELQNPK